MEAQGPMARSGNSLALGGSGAVFERSEAGHDFSVKRATALALAGSTVAVNADPVAGAGVAGGGADARVAELLLSSRGSTLKELVSIIGIDGAARLIGAFAGMRLYVPHEPEPDDSLSEVIGLQAAQALAQMYGGDRIDVPNPTPRRIQIVDLRANGVSIDGIARELRCTRRRVFQVLAEARSKHRSRKLPQSQ
ncbi:MAG TPA: helix-turn-helix domain-containing protein [Candidatus Binataceae bacterium]|jgi:hypothetical protein|nr:helix-turn-helix domain-containing protein [Candidatus Binataceae bacterium]